jgi:hypothetical protein
MLYRGALQVLVVEHWATGSVDAIEISLDRRGDTNMSPWWFRTTSVNAPSFRGNYSESPLWFLIALCLACPVTSFILARRRRKGRGFPVEAGSGGPAPGIDPPPRRPDNIPPP